MKIYTLSVRVWDDDHECDCNIQCPPPKCHWELIGVYHKSTLAIMLTEGFTHPHNREIIVKPGKYYNDEPGCFTGEYNFGYFKVEAWSV